MVTATLILPSHVLLDSLTGPPQGTWQLLQKRRNLLSTPTGHQGHWARSEPWFRHLLRQRQQERMVVRTDAICPQREAIRSQTMMRSPTKSLWGRAATDVGSTIIIIIHALGTLRPY